MGNRKPRAAIYLRLSRDHETQTSIERQEADCRRRAKAEGMEVVENYVDVGISGYKKVVRPEYDRLREDVRAGLVDVVLVWKIDRLTRGGIASAGRFLDDLAAGGARLIGVMDGVDTATASGELVVAILASIAKAESENISTRTRSAKSHAAAQGLPRGGGRRPFGYADTLYSKVVPREAKLIREARDRILEGESKRSIAADWTRRKITTTGGNNFTASALGRTMTSPSLAALIVTDEGPVEGTWEPIVTVDDHERLVAAKGHHRPVVRPRALLSGMLRCGLCESTMTSKSTQRYGRQYSCRGCGRLTTKSEPIEELVLALAEKRLDDPAVAAALVDSGTSRDTSEVVAALDADRLSLRQLAHDHYVARFLTRDEFLAAREPLELSIAEHEATLAREASASADLPTDPVDALRTGDDETKRMVLRSLIEAIDLAPTEVRGRAKFDPERVHPRWRA